MGSRNAAAVALAVLSWIFRLAAIALCLIVIVLCFSGLVAKLNIVGFIVDLSRALPASIAGWGVIASPFGGVFRFDFALVALACFILDYVCQRASRLVR